jgi:hypothetical protein
MAEMTVPAGRSAYPVTIDVVPQLENRNRLTTFFRLILAIPHLILVGGPIWLGAGGSFGIFGDRNFQFYSPSWGSSGVIGLVAFVIAVIAWFAIVFTGNHPRGLWDFKRFFLRWRVNAVAYVALFRDEYPPFGDSSNYGVNFAVDYPEQERNRLSVFLRLIYVIPHLIVLFFLGIAWWVITVIAWFAILFSGRYPQSMYDFSTGVFRWNVRVEAYVFLLRDEYPPFSLEP